MKATELMIGDWVIMSHKYYTKNEKVMSIEAVQDGFLKCEPIPLTEDILKANGFFNVYLDKFHSTNEWSCSQGFFHIYYEYSKKYWWISSSGTHIHFHYVHELQHALRLCGLTDLADNFKVV